MSFQRSQERKRRLKKLYDATKNSCCRGVYYDRKKKRYKRYSVGSESYKRYLRRCTNKHTRKSDFIGNYGKYRRIYDYWWNLF